MPRPQHLDASPIHDADAIYRRLTEVPLSVLSVAALKTYASSAVATIGGADDYRHFLPRILELSLHGRSGWDPDEIPVRLEWAEWRGWPEDERAAILAFFHSAFCWSLDTDPEEDGPASSWLLGLAALGEPVAPCLDQWRRVRSANSVLQLANFACEWQSTPVRRRLSDDNGALVDAWLHSTETSEQLVEGVDRVAPSEVWRIETAMTCLD